ncbi:MAG TPA: SDR family NAD(P)-dependent oxidoreductase [Thermoanaerobaculia bacterium]
MARHIHETLAPRAESLTEPPNEPRIELRTEPRTAPPAAREPVAIIGMSGRFPGAADVETFWRNVRAGVCSVAEVPRSRWSVEGLECKWGGFLDGIDEFDAPFFNISAKEAQVTDPQQRLFLEEAWRAIEDAGLTAAQLDGTRCGVFAGAGGGDFIHRIAAEGIEPDGYAFMGNASSILAARISYLLNLKGPSLAVDTACSSSLVAVHLACESLALGTCDLALAGGVCILNTSNFYVAGSKAGMLSRSGACRTFDRDADGFVPAEGVGVLVLKPLAKALADGDRIHGVIEGSATNQDGRTNGITAPSAPSQTAVELAVYEKFGIAPDTIGYVEAHGTGTRLGDPIEVEALTAAFRKFTAARGFCAIGSSKTNIGHAMSASGMAGIIKVLKALEAAELPPSVHFHNENEAIGFADTPFRVNSAVEPWPQPPGGGPRRAAVSSFGFSGTNAHLVIAAPPAVTPAAPPAGPLPFVLSAKTESALAANRDALRDWLMRHPDAPLASVSYTLLAGRNPFEHRAVVYAATRQELLAGLAAPSPCPELPAASFDPAPPKLSLPTYRFDRRRYTLGESTKPKTFSAMHPLLDRDDSNRFTSRFSPSLPFLRDHVVLGRSILPGACFVEMVLAAARVRDLADVAFRAPLVADGDGVDVELELRGDDVVIRSASAEIATARLLRAPSRPRPSIDLDAWLALPESDVDALFAAFEAAGVVLGPYCRGLRRLRIDGDEAFAELQLPAGESRSLAHYTLHPTLIDGAFQAAMALLAPSSGGVLVPASIGAVSVIAPLPAICYAHVHLSGPRSFDLAFFDEDGAPLASLERFGVSELARAGEPALRFYRPHWIEVATGEPLRADGVTLVVRAPDAAFDAPLPLPSLDVVLGDACGSAGPGQWQIDAASPMAFSELIASLKPLGSVLFLGGADDPQRDAVALLHLLQTLPRAELRVVVSAPPENGAVIGFAQTASREQSRLRFTVIETAHPTAALLEESGQEAGVVLAERHGRRFRRTLVPAERRANKAAETFRHRGVYLIAGGAGGIGLELARHLRERYEAHVVLLGRRERDLDGYRRVDVADRDAVAAVVAEMKQRWGSIHGVVHAAMVLRDSLVDTMDAASLRAVLAPKLAGSRVLAELFEREPLDFFAFFSSANSFFGNAGQANYAAASTAQDAVARALAARAPYRVRIVNWGFWGDVGAVATPRHRERALAHGIGAIRVDEGLRAFEEILRGDDLQVMPMKVEPATLAKMGLLAASQDDDIAAAFAAVENYGRAQLRRYIDREGRLSIPTAPKFARLRAALEAIAAKPAEPQSPPAGGWTQPFATLIDRCLEHYPGVLSGALNPAEVLFPGGSAEWVAPLYRGNPIVDRYNHIVAEEIVAYVRELLRTRDRVRIFEMGAGTGGTSRGVLEALAPFAGRVEFVFTDLSGGLVRQARNELAARYPFARFAVFDMEKEPRAQQIEENAFDLVFASNALHATRNIAATLRNARRLLRDGGRLLLNEAIRLHDFSTLTFGLTEGWWAFDDPERRLPHSPLLDEALWRGALAECFEEIDVRGGESQAVFAATARATAVAAEAVRPAEARGAERVIRRQVAAALGVASSEIDVDRRFNDLGFDSILGVDLVKRVNEALGCELPVTILFDYPSVRQLAAKLDERGAAVIEVPAPAPSSAMQIAVVGLACRFPGARDARAFWRDLRDGVCRIGEVPRARWDVSRYYDPDPAKPGKSPCKWGGFLDGVDEFDPAFFHMSGAEAEYTDPQQRLFVQEAWHALEDAGYAPVWLDGRRCGVFVGAGAGDYIHNIVAGEPPPYAFLGNGVSVLASRISYLLNLRGPALAVDTACSSSLLAVHLACQSLRSGECDLALAGGVFVSTTPSFHYLTGRLGMLSPTGLCRAFDDGADGFIPGEGAGVVVLRPLDAALRDGDFIYGLIAGSGANQDGHTNGLTAPSSISQAELEAEVYERAGIDPSTISYVETHGTGTKLGDPLEIEGLTNAFRRFTNARGFCAIGSVKTNIGHAGPAAGIAGLIKVLLAMRHGEIPPTLHFDRPNRNIDFPSTPFFVAAERRRWTAAPRRAAVSAFGLSGTNVHVVVDDAPPPPPRAAASERAPIFAVSAMSEESLSERVTELRVWLEEHGQEHAAADIAYTLGACRQHFRYRAVLNAPPDHPLASRYLAGEEIDWLAEYPPSRHRRVPLPGYPFSRERYWIPDATPRAAEQELHLFERVWVEAAAQPAADDPDVAVLEPGRFDTVDGYLDFARQASALLRVLVAHRAGDHNAAATSALHHSLRFVHPRLVWQTVEVAGDAAAIIERERRAGPDAAEVRYRDGVREVRRCAPLATTRGAAPLRKGGVYWITGGAGSIGSRVARWLVEKYDARVVVTSRHAPPQPLGRNIDFIAADVADAAAMRAALAEIRARYGGLHGVIHAAGRIEAPLLTQKSDSRSVLAPKIDGVRVLDDVTRDEALDFFVLFSSLSAIAGDFGQCDYAVANRYLESFAEWRAARRSGRTVAIHWPLWAEGAMHLPESEERGYVESSGLEPLGTAEAMRALETALGSTALSIVVACGDRARIEELVGVRRRELPAAKAAAAPAPASSNLEEIVLARTAGIVKLPLSKLTRDSRFSDVGLDSLYMKDLAAALGQDLGVALTPTVFFEHQTIAALAAHLGAEYPRSAPVVVPDRSDEPIAIIGMAGRFPQSRDLDELWSHLVAGHDLITEVPPERWDWRLHQTVTGREHDKSVSRWGGFMPDLDKFDAAFFGISPREAVFMDPQHRLFLETVWSALEDAGVRASSLAGRNVGVWVGAQLNEYMGLIGDAGEARAQAAIGNTQTMLANRVSFWFDFRGPSQTVDTACSSALVAVHRAVQSLRNGECEIAVAGGVSAILSPDTYVLASQLGMLSPDGRCKTFDRSANGYVKGEGVGAVLLKPLSRALADGDHVHAVIRSTAEGHGGRASSLTAPNPQAQAQLLVDAYRRAGVGIDTISYVETHGTGTELGDPVEVDALTRAFQTVAAEQGVVLGNAVCGLGSIKSNIGHLEPAAGMAGLIKVVLAMRTRTLPPTLHVRDVNPYLKLDGSPFRLVLEPAAWDASPLRAGVSAFGFGGSNAHVVLEEAPAVPASDDRSFAAAVPLSAKTPEALRAMAAALCDHLERAPQPWRDVVFTLREGREEFEQRLSIQASSCRELTAKLRAWLDGAAIEADAVLPAPPAGRRVSLPPYPFAKTRIWFDRRAPAAPAPAQAPAHVDDVRAMLAELLYLEPSAIAEDASFVDLGLDSILAVEFAKKLQDRFGIDLRATRLYDYSTVRDLAAYLGGSTTAPAVEAPAVAVAATPAGATVDEIRAMLAELLYLEPSAVAEDASFAELGLDSILAVEFAKKLQDRFGTDLRAARLYDYSTVRDLAAHLGAASTVEPLTPAARPAPDAESDIAIIGMSGRFPGAPTLADFWRNLADGVDSITDIPPQRFAADERMQCAKGGFLDDIDQFDPLFFKISPQEAEWMDPQQRLFLEQAWLALEDAGLSDRALAGASCAVFAGAGQGDYFRLMEGSDNDASAQFGIGNVSSILAARIAYLLDLKGPAVSIDTACSSSLVAVHLACQALRGGECDLALAGGVSLMITPQMHLLTSASRMLSPDGKCKTFDSEANGFVPGEGVGAVVLKRLAAAVADGDRIYAVIRGSGTNQDGRTNGITAPSAQSQTALQLAVYERYGIDPSTITYVEAHGTGTKLGDPIEIDALTDSFRRFTKAARFCAVGSVKTNIGHTLPAAGMAGLIKSVLALRARKIPPSLHCGTENEHIDFARSPFFVNRELREWLPVPGAPRRAAVSSFGFSGTNAHLVLDERPEPPAPPSAGPWSFVLSARTPESLRRYALTLAEWLGGDGATVPLADVAFTLSERRSRFRHQRVVNAGDRAVLIAKLRAQDDAGDAPLPAPRGRVVSLPPYAFQRRRFWVPAKNPLLDSMRGDLLASTATKRFAPADELMAQHLVGGAPTLPGAALLEMVLECGGPGASLRDVVWLRPFQNEETLSVALRSDGKAILFESPYCRGRIVFEAPEAHRRDLDLDSGEPYDSGEIYAAFERLGIRHGEALRRIEWLRRDGARVIAKLSVPSDGVPYVLDPRVIDAALQTPIGFALGRSISGPAMVPYSIDRVVRHAPLTNPCYAIATLLSGDPARFDIALVSAGGEMLAELSGFSTRAVRPPDGVREELTFLQPRWRIAAQVPDRPLSRERVLILRPERDHGLTAALARHHHDRGAVTSLLLGNTWREEDGDPIELDHRAAADWERLAQSLPSIGRVYFLGGLTDSRGDLTPEALDRFQEVSAISLFRFVRAWTRANRTLPGIVVVTNDVHGVSECDAFDPRAASLDGLAAVIGREFPSVDVALLDVDRASLADPDRLAPLVAQALPGAFVRRREQLFTRTLELVQLPGQSLVATSPFRRGGAYVILGGGGGLGRGFAEHLARERHARLLLVGRSAAGDAVRATLEAIHAAGGEGFYHQADIADVEALGAARRAVIERWGAIHGVIHAALTLHDQTIARLDENSFRETLRAKGRGTASAARVFRDDALDWLLLFSSTISFTTNAGQSSYAAASTLQDAVGLALGRTAPWPVKIVNWGYWGEIGAVATDRHRARARSLGVGSITLPEGVQALERVLESGLPHVAVLKVLDAKPAEETWRRHDAVAPPFPPLDPAAFQLPVDDESRRLSEALLRLETCGRRILGAQVRSLSEAEVEPKYRRLFAAARALALDSGERPPAAELDEMRQIAGLEPFVDLLSAALRDFRQVVTGRKSATEVLFPGSSSSLVDAVYRGGPLAAEYNQLVGRLVAALVVRPLSILEAGAGTGSVTRSILEALAGRDATYDFTDVSSHFVHQAEEILNGAPVRPRFAVLDVEADPAAQGFAAGSYDVVVAVNVVHATRSIAATLQRVKKLLKRGGALVLAEMAGRSDFSAMTFGLTEGWWRFEDGERRQPHSPLLSVPQWEASLAEAGYRNVRVLGAASGQVILLAESDGWYRDARDAAERPVRHQEPPAAVETSIAAQTSTIDSLREIVSAVLRIRGDELENDALFEEYGVDSLVSIDILQKLEPRYGTLSYSLLYEHNTIVRLAAHLDARNGTSANEPALVTLGGAGDGPRTFWVHSVLGEVDWVSRLARHLPPSWPVHAFRAPFVRNGVSPHATLESMAAAYVAELRAVQPHGPYVVGGYSLGGAVAYEMARQLVRAGERVPWLILLDAFGPDSRALRSLHETSWDGFLPKVIEALLGLAGAERDVSALVQRSLQIANHNAALLDAYAPEPCPMRAVLFRNRHSFIGAGSPLGMAPVRIDDRERDHGWTRWLGSTPRVIELDTDHFSLGLEPVIGEVARQLVELLDPRAEHVFDVVRENIHRVLPDLPRELITLEASLRDLGANSLDRVEVATCAMETLKLRISPAHLAGVQNIAGLVDVFVRHLPKEAM